jgi:predicted GIY-YIG superfamily endonuclease
LNLSDLIEPIRSAGPARQGKEGAARRPILSEGETKKRKAPRRDTKKRKAPAGTQSITSHKVNKKRKIKKMSFFLLLEPPTIPLTTNNYVYCLSQGKYTYVGATVNPARRLRQHNGEIKGGARATTKRSDEVKWTRAILIGNIPTWRDALQIEWKWKWLTRRGAFSGSPMERRIAALQKLFSEPRATSRATPFAEWTTLPCLVEGGDLLLA